MDVEFRLSQGGRGGVPVLLELEESDTVLLPLSMVELLEEMVELSREAVELFKDMTVPFAAMHAGGSKDESVELASAATRQVQGTFPVCIRTILTRGWRGSNRCIIAACPTVRQLVLE
jgi:hypothetical protein